MSSADRTWDEPHVDTGATTEHRVASHRGLGPLPSRYESASVEILGEGGLGTVWSVFDSVTGRKVALKTLHRRPDTGRASRGMERRFLREARITAQLQHPGIVPVYEIGRLDDGTQFYTMKRIRGRTLEAAVRGLKTLTERLSLIPELVQVAHAVAYAHSRGVVHRDLKPANVMVGEFGETLVLDWGIARLTGDLEDPDEGDAITDNGAQDRTAVGTVMGTPAYMSPEQARGDLDTLDTRSDVWSLGVMVFQVVAGRRPFDGPDVLDAVRHGVAPRLRDAAPECPPELAAIAARALSADPADRYPTAGDLAHDLEAWLEGRMVSTYQYGLSERVGRVYDRVRTVVVTAAVCGAAGLGAIAWLAAVHRGDLRRASDVLRAERLEAAVAVAASEPGTAAARFAAVLEDGDDPAVRGLLLDASSRWAPIRRVHTARAGCSAVTFSAGTAVCAPDPRPWPADLDSDGVDATARDDGTLTLRTPDGWTTVSPGGGSGRLAFTGRWILDRRADGTLWFVDPRARAILGRLPSKVLDAAASPEGGSLAVVTPAGDLEVWDLPTADASLQASEAPLDLLRVGDDWWVLRDDAVERRAAGTMALRAPAVSLGSPIRFLGTASDGAVIAVQTAFGVASLSASAEPRLWSAPPASRGMVLVDASRVVLAGDDGVPVLWDLYEARELARFDHRWRRALARGPARSVVFEAAEGGVSVLDLDTQRLVPVALPSLDGASASPGGARAVAPADGGLAVVDLATGQRTATFPVNAPIAACAVDDAGDRVAWTTSSPPRVHLARADGSVLATLDRADVTLLAFSPDGAGLWVGTPRGAVRWDLGFARSAP